MIGCTGWVVAPDYSGADAPFDHPFGFDWEFQVALDDDRKGYQELLNPANINPEESGIGQLLASEQGLPMRRGLLGVEWDGNLIPQSFKARVRHGDRVAAFGRWILDTGHNFGKFWRTEIHPPLLLVSASVENNPRAPGSTRALFMSRPYLPGQHYAVDPANAYLDSVDDDGPFLSHLVNELVKVITLRSRMVEAHPKIKSTPFEGSYQFTVKVRPPARPRGAYRLAVSFQFTVRNGCSVECRRWTAKQGILGTDIYVGGGFTMPAVLARARLPNGMAFRGQPGPPQTAFSVPDKRRSQPHVGQRRLAHIGGGFNQAGDVTRITSSAMTAAFLSARRKAGQWICHSPSTYLHRPGGRRYLCRRTFHRGGEDSGQPHRALGWNELEHRRRRNHGRRQQREPRAGHSWSG